MDVCWGTLLIIGVGPPGGPARLRESATARPKLGPKDPETSGGDRGRRETEAEEGGPDGAGRRGRKEGRRRAGDGGRRREAEEGGGRGALKGEGGLGGRGGGGGGTGASGLCAVDLVIVGGPPDPE